MNKFGFVYITIEINSDGKELFHYGKRKIGIGHTYDDIRRFKEHHSRGSKASVGVKFIHVINCNEIGIPCEEVEKRVHLYLEDFGYDHIDRTSHYDERGEKLTSTTEVFSGKSSVNIENVVNKNDELSDELIVKIIINLSHVDLFKNKLELHPHQGNDIIIFDDGSEFEGTSLFIKRRLFENSSRQILLNHKPRSGKTFIVYGYLLEYKPKNVLVLTNYPTLNNQWINEAKKIRDLNYDFINMSQDYLIKDVINDDTPNFVIMSLQDSKGGEEIFGKRKFDLIRNIKWDLLVIDECHKGVLTSKTEKLLKKIKYDKMIGLSATPTKHLILGTFTKEDIHSYNIIDEKKFKVNFPDIYTLPDISYCIYNPPQSVKNELKYYGENEQFNWSKFLKVEDGRLVYKNDIRILFMWIAGNYGAIHAPLKKFDANSVLLFVQNTECQELLVELLNEISFYRENYNIYYTNSNINSATQLYEKTKNEYIPKGDDKKSLIIANRQLTTGITLKYCDMVMFMNDWESLDEFIQASFRCQSPLKGKKTCQVIDFTPYRTFVMLGRYIENNTMSNGKSLDQNRKEFFDSASLFESVDNGFKELNINDFKERFVESLDIGDKNFFTNTNLIRKEEVARDCEWLYEKLGHIESGSNDKIEERLDDNGIEKGKTKKTLGEKKDKKKDESDKRLLWALENIEYFLGKTPLLSIICDYKKDNLDDCLDYIHSSAEREKNFIDFLSLDGQLNIDFATADFIYRNYTNLELLNDRILTVNTKFRKLIYTENKSLRVINIEKVLELIESYVGVSKIEKKLLGEVMTPAALVNEMIDTIPVEFWNSPEHKLLEPSNGTGVFVLIAIQRLMKGLETWQPDEELRFKHIIENMIYVCELQPKNMFIYLQLFDPNNEYKMNYYRGSFLDEKFDKHMKEIWEIEGFDLVMGNPPYKISTDNNVYVTFTKRSMSFLKKEGLLLFIVLKNIYNYFNNDNNLVKYQIEYIKFDVVFETLKNLSIAYFLMKNSKRISDINILDSNGILAKCIDGKNDFNLVAARVDNKNYLKENKDDNFKYPVLSKLTKKEKQILWTNKEHPSMKKNKVIFSRLGDNFIIDDGYYTNGTSGNFYILTDNKIQSENLVKLSKSKIFRYIAEKMMFNRYTLYDTFKTIKKVDLDIDTTDENLYRYFKLTENEIKLIENTIK